MAAARCAVPCWATLAASAVKNGWAGVVVWGAVRDTAALAALPLAVFAIAVNPMRSVKRGAGERDVPVRFGGVGFTPGHWLAVDSDGLIVAPRPLD
jgi:regulator of ribonuclease activity A